MIDIMLNLKTWGKKPGCDIRSIGATVFNRVTGKVGIDCPTCKGGGDCSDCMNTRTDPLGEFYIAVDNPIWHGDAAMHHDNHFDETAQAWRKYPLHRDPQTVQWWSEQSDEAQAAFANPVDLKEGLYAFRGWLDVVTNAPDQCLLPVEKRTDFTLWSHGPAFDPPILAAAYDAVGLSQPWHYRAPRDTRTILEAAGIDLKQFSTGIYHHALNDAQCQAAAVCAAFSRLRVSHDVVTHRDAWRRALMHALQSHAEAYNGKYWEHELDAFDRLFADLANHPCLER